MAGINIISSELVRPSEATPHGPFWLSNLDLGVRSGYSPMIYLFRPLGVGCPADFFSADILRTALSRALVPFYPLAGRLGMAPDGRLEIDCSGQGAVFVVARSDAVLEDLEGFAPSKAMCDMFVPPYEEVVGASGKPLLLLQVTFLHGGGVVLGTGMHHYALDGRSSFHFMQTWSSLARGAAGDTVPPFLDRSPLRARSPPVILFDHFHEYCRNGAGSATGAARPSDLAGAILRVTSAQAAALRARTGESLFRSLVAHIWRCALTARALPSDAESRLYTVVDMRARLSPPLPSAYFGNAGVRTSVSAKVGDVLASPLKFGAQRLRMATGQGDEYARSLVDYLETAADASSKPGRELPDTDLRVISWMGMASHDANFGWGEPAGVAPAAVSYTWFVYSVGDSGDVAVAVAMKPDQLERFKELFFHENEMAW
ncbi:hydroxycinnamoyltransferase 4 [Lolium perenne]|uniref:hydroxycinnamoyltransferase 4 n=1 Tax=Lolium perenne TaxID=4522 RepID=UPI0021F557E9|nr:hydroxycinnamoyltransferase 4-like isoform X2 [Lolium perenne]